MDEKQLVFIGTRLAYAQLELIDTIKKELKGKMDIDAFITALMVYTPIQIISNVTNKHCRANDLYNIMLESFNKMALIANDVDEIINNLKAENEQELKENPEKLFNLLFEKQYPKPRDEDNDDLAQ